MSERGHFRGGGARGRGGDRGGRGGRGGGAPGEQRERPKKENIIDLNRFMDKELKVKFNGGREGMHKVLCCPFHKGMLNSFVLVVGVLKGFDQLMNLVLDEVQEVMRGVCLRLLCMGILLLIFDG